MTRIKPVHIWLVLCLTMLMFNSAQAAVNGLTQYKYVINLASSTRPLSVEKYRDAVLDDDRRLFAISLKSKSKYRYRIRLGFFASRRQALAYIAKLPKAYRDAWPDVIKKEDLSQLRQPGTVAASRADVKDYGSLGEEKLNALIEKARVAMVSKQYDQAIRLYTKILNSGGNVYQREAQEYLGLARERNGQLAHAKAEYRIYLARYPRGEDADRVRQRLAALVSASWKPSDQLPEFKASNQSADWIFYGTLLQFYDRDEIDTNRFGNIVASSVLSTHFNMGGRSTYEGYKMRTDFGATHVYDLQDSETDDDRILSMYFDVVTPGRTMEARAGRQKGRSGGVVGRFDGVDLGYRFSPEYRIKLIAGFPYDKHPTVASTTDKYFYSLGLDIGPFQDNWDISIYAIQQMADGIVDRQEVGAEFRYRTQRESLFSLFDYSTDFGTVNYFMTVYNRQLENRASLDIIVDYRKSPFLSSSSALQGQVGVSTLNDLLETLDEDEIEQLSLQRTATYKSLTTLYRKPLSERLEVNADFTLSNLSGTDASLGVEATEGTGNEYSASAGVIANSLWLENDINIANLRFSKFYSSDVMVLNLSSKYRIGRKWRINPRFRYEDRSYDDGRDVNKLRPSVRVQYRYNRDMELEIQLEYEDRTQTDPVLADVDETSYRLYAGYIYTF